MFYVLLAIGLVLFVLCLWSPTRDHVVRWARVLWVCRASAVSAGLGLVLFAVAPPARDLFAERAAGQVYWVVFFVLVFLWALIVHYGARKALEQQAWAAAGHSLPLRKRLQSTLQARYAVSGTWMPRLLGLLCFVGVALGIVGARTTSTLLGDEAAANASGFGSLLAVTAAVAALYLAYVVCRRLAAISLTTSLKGDPSAIIDEPDPFWFMKLAALRRRAARHAGRSSPDVKAVLLVGATVTCFVAATAFPIALSYFVPRAWFVPMMLGLPLFAIAFVTAISHYIRFPVLLFAALAFGWLATLAPNFHNARVAPRPTNARERQVGLKDALAEWKRLSCEREPGPRCGKHPVVLALAGGASRAAFFSATVVGSLIDMTRGSSGLQRDFAQQVFAISGVSGGSVGAAMIRAALEDAEPGGAPPCESADGLWFGAVSDPGWNRFYGQTEAPGTWKGCLQALTAGDFLSPAVLGLAFRDGFAGPITLAKTLFPNTIDGHDRGALLELAFETRYATILAKPSTPGERFRSLLAREALEGRKALGRPFGRPDLKFWAPVLLLNATSVDTGRRVVASELKPTYENGKRLFPEAYDLFVELARTFKKTDWNGKIVYDDADTLAPVPDIPLSTAATLSARFPVVSPYGGLRNPAAIQTADRLVDGGYFENDGVTTAFELARAISEIDTEVRPVIVHITNDPVGRYDARDPQGRIDAFARPPNMPKARPSEFFESVVNPLTALFGTRGGHAAEAVREVLLARDRMGYFRFQVFDQGPDEGSTPCDLRNKRGSKSGTRIDSVSMSWWLSGAVQEYLDRQLCQSDNGNEYDRLAPFLTR
jgi:hypothetical protein